MLPVRPRGVAALLFGVMLPVFIGFAALAVDTSMVAVARGQLSTAADAAALAGAQQLATENRVRAATTLTTEITGANNQSLAFAQKNSVLGTTPVLSTNVSNASQRRYHGGLHRLDQPQLHARLFGRPATKLFNSVQVTLHRDADHGGVVPTIFAHLMGFCWCERHREQYRDGPAVLGERLQGVRLSSANLLPIVLDTVTWQAMMTHEHRPTTTDQYTYNPPTNTVTSGADGVYESQLYPVGSGSPGNWGTIKVGVSNNSTSTLGAQIRYGITPAQLATFPNSTIPLDTTQTPPSITFSGNPGISAGIKDDLTAIIGKPVVVPIYDINGGNGNNAWYRVIAFAGPDPERQLPGQSQVRDHPACLVNDPTAVTGTAQSWTKGGQVKLYLSR